MTYIQFPNKIKYPVVSGYLYCIYNFTTTAQDLIDIRTCLFGPDNSKHYLPDDRTHSRIMPNVNRFLAGLQPSSTRRLLLSNDNT